MENRIVRIEVKLEMMEKTLEKTVNILEELVKSEVYNQELNKRLAKVENSLSRLNWMVITSVFGAVLALVVKG
jgi:septation ring formation regulator EzrA